MADISIVFWGQSNSKGFCASEEYPTGSNSARRLWTGAEALQAPIQEPSGGFPESSIFTSATGPYYSMVTTCLNGITLAGGDTVTAIHADKSGSGFIDYSDWQKNWNLRGTPYLFQSMIDHVKSYVQTPDYFIAYQGENEMICETSYCTDTDYLAALRTFIADVRIAFNSPNLPIILCQTGNITTGKNPQSWYVRHAHGTIANDPNVYLCCTYDLTTSDGTHLSTSGYDSIGNRVANCINYLCGNSGYYRGPNCTSVAINGGRTIVTAAINKGVATALAANGSLANVAIIQMGESRLYPDTTEISGSTIVFTFAFPLVFRGSITVRYATLANSGIGNYVNGNDDLSLPLEPFLETIQGE